MISDKRKPRIAKWNNILSDLFNFHLFTNLVPWNLTRLEPLDIHWKYSESNQLVTILYAAKILLRKAEDFLSTLNHISKFYSYKKTGRRESNLILLILQQSFFFFLIIWFIFKVILFCKQIYYLLLYKNEIWNKY